MEFKSVEGNPAAATRFSGVKSKRLHDADIVIDVAQESASRR